MISISALELATIQYKKSNTLIELELNEFFHINPNFESLATATLSKNQK